MLMQQQLTGTVPAVAELRPPGSAAITDVPGRAGPIAERGRSGSPDYAATYLWLDAGQSWPFLRRFDPISERVLLGWLFVVAACCLWAMSTMVTGGTRPEEATRQMEQLAAQLEGTKAIPAATANAVARLLGQPWYDCRNVACSPELVERNEAARGRLHQLLASKGPANEVDLSASRTPRASAENWD